MANVSADVARHNRRCTTMFRFQTAVVTEERRRETERTEWGRDRVRHRSRSPRAVGATRGAGATERRTSRGDKITSKGDVSAAADNSVGDKPKPAIMLDDLFRKTTVQPALYWRPLTDEQVFVTCVIFYDTKTAGIQLVG